MSITDGASGQADVRGRFLGVWRLVSCERKYNDGKVVYPYGEKPVGRITYDKAGRMSAQLMRPGRCATVPSGTSLMSASVEEIRDAVNGFISYYGNFDVDEARETVIHHVQVCLIPSWVGTDLKRAYKFESNRLILTAAAKDSATVLTWEREGD